MRDAEVVRTGGKGYNHIRYVGEELPICRMHPSPKFKVLKRSLPSGYPVPREEYNEGFWCGSCAADYFKS